jgi:hypothetical protein
MARIPLRLAGPVTSITTSTTLYTVPSVTKTIVRHIHVSNPTSAAVTFTLSIGADAAGTRLFDAYSIASSTVLDHYCYYVLEATEILASHASTTSATVVTIDGDTLVLG